MAVLGADGAVHFHPYLRDTDIDAAGDDIAFLTVGDLISHSLVGTVLPGPAVFYRTIGLMVADRSPVLDSAHLGDGAICFEPGSPADRAVEGYFAAHHLRLHPMPFQEADEMRDAFDDGRCEAVAEDVTVLAALRAQLDDPYRILPDVIAATPVLAVSSLDDARWGAVIAWTVATLIRAEANGGVARDEQVLRLMPVAAPSLGLLPGWQLRVIGAVGDYAAIYRRHLGAGSPLRLARGMNALREQGGVLVAPATE